LVKDPSGKFALITGASKGLGRSLALELARRKINTLLSSFPGENLNQVCEEARSMGTESYYYETDLLDKKNILALTDWANSNFSINLLINNVGCGGSESFTRCDADYIDRIIQLNITATSLITHQILPNLIMQGKSRILNVSSVASFSPMGYKTVYPASKRFVQHFSKGLRQELKTRNVTVSVVYPGPIITNEEVSKRIEHQGAIGKMVSLSPERVAEITVSKLLRGKSFILAGWANKLMWLLMVTVPDFIKVPILTSIYRKDTNCKTSQ
jgi:short-subunit dehydrogenase